MSGSKCTYCGSVLPPVATDCPRCGQSLPVLGEPEPVGGVGHNGRKPAGGREAQGRLAGIAAPALLLAAVLGVAAGQFYISIGKDERTSVIFYALGIVALASALLAERFSPRHLPESWHLLRVRSLPIRLLAGVLACLLFALALLIMNLPRGGGPALVAWLASLSLTLRAALPDEFSLLAYARRQCARLRSASLTGEAVAVVAILTAGTVLRLYDLAAIPSGIVGDEAAFGTIARSVLEGNGPHPFGTAFLDDPALLFYMEAPFLAIFGDTNLVALRLFSATCGSLTLLAFYALVREMFGRRPALLALALLAVNAAHIHFSRLGIDIAPGVLFAALALYALWHAKETKRPFW
ncbi:MAG: ArnT family glycosyltransferase, partial [Chloroflexota bacterium]